MCGRGSWMTLQTAGVFGRFITTAAAAMPIPSERRALHGRLSHLEPLLCAPARLPPAPPTLCAYRLQCLQLPRREQEGLPSERGNPRSRGTSLQCRREGETLAPSARRKPSAAAVLSTSRVATRAVGEARRIPLECAPATQIPGPKPQGLLPRAGIESCSERGANQSSGQGTTGSS